MDDIDGAYVHKWRNPLMEDGKMKGKSRKAYVNHYCDTMTWEEVLNEIGYAM